MRLPRSYCQALLLALLLPMAAVATSQVAAGTLPVEEVEFVSHGARLSGSLVLPRKSADSRGRGVHPRLGKTDPEPGLGRAFRARGYRGAGVRQARRRQIGWRVRRRAKRQRKKYLPAGRRRRCSAEPARQSSSARRAYLLGISGISQAGWIAPLAAARSRRAAFLVLWSGPVCKVSEEDIFSKFTADQDARSVPSYRQALDSRAEKYTWPDFLGRDTDSSEDLARLKIPGLWIFSDNDASIPVDLSIQRLQSLRDAPPLRLRPVPGPGTQQHGRHLCDGHGLDQTQRRPNENGRSLISGTGRADCCWTRLLARRAIQACECPCRKQ